MRALESSVCMDAACRCPMHRLPDIGMLAVWDLDLVTMRLSGSQARLLACLLPPGLTVMHAVLLRRVWGECHLQASGNQLIAKFMYGLRRKLPQRWRIVSVAGAGYRLERVSREQHQRGVTPARGAGL